VLLLENFPCSLTEVQIEGISNADTRQWLIDDGALANLDDDVQAIINCTSAGDTILIRTKNTITPRATLTIPWNITLSGYLENILFRNGTIQEATNKARITCPRNGHLIVAR